MPTIVRVSNVDLHQDFGETIKKYDPNFFQTRSVLGNTLQYVLYSELPLPYLIMVSRQKDTDSIWPGHNFIFTAASDSSHLNNFNTMEFQAKTGIVLRPTSPGLENRFKEAIYDLFQLFKNKPEAAKKAIRS